MSFLRHKSICGPPYFGYVAHMRIKSQKQATVLLVIFVLGFSTIFFRFVEGWVWFDAFYFSIITMSTVGYGNIVPVTFLGKVGVIFLIFFGVGTLALMFQIIASDAIAKRVSKEAKDDGKTL